MVLLHPAVTADFIASSADVPRATKSAVPPAILPPAMFGRTRSGISVCENLRLGDTNVCNLVCNSA